MPQSTSTASWAEAQAKRPLALEAAGAAGFDALVASTPPTVRWLLAGRGRPISAPESPYRVTVTADRAVVLVPDIEEPRVEAEERFEELGYEVETFPWFEGPDRVVRELVGGLAAATDSDVEEALAPSRRSLCANERERYRDAGAAAAEAMVACVHALSPEETELEATARLAYEARTRGFFPPVVLVGGEARLGVYRHPLPTEERLGRQALLAVTAERDGLHVSLTRIVSFGPPPKELERLARIAAEVDAVVLAASRPGTRLGEVFAAGARAYADRGYPEEWRFHHQGGLTGYAGREVFAVPDEPTPLPASCAVAWNPSVTGGGKSEDTALVSADGVEVVSRTPELAESEIDGLVRPAIAVL